MLTLFCPLHCRMFRQLVSCNTVMSKPPVSSTCFTYKKIFFGIYLFQFQTRSHFRHLLSTVVWHFIMLRLVKHVTCPWGLNCMLASLYIRPVLNMYCQIQTIGTCYLKLPKSRCTIRDFQDTGCVLQVQNDHGVGYWKGGIKKGYKKESVNFCN